MYWTASVSPFVPGSRPSISSADKRLMSVSAAFVSIFGRSLTVSGFSGADEQADANITSASKDRRVMTKVYVPLLVALALLTQRPTFFESPYALDQMKGKQAVVDTDLGTFVIQLLPERAPNHVGHFMKLANDGSYVGTIFHRVIRYGL